MKSVRSKLVATASLTEETFGVKFLLDFGLDSLCAGKEKWAAGMVESVAGKF